MAGKVDICGIDTSKLPVLSSQRMQELFKEIKQGRAGAREEFIGGNLRLVLSVVQRFAHRGENADDLFQVGCIGLIKAIDHFDVTQEVKFSTYAVPMIIGEIRRYLRDNNAIRVSRSMRDIAYRALQARDAFVNEHGKEPTIDEIAKRIDLPREDVIFALDAIADPISLFEPISNESGDPVYMMDLVGDDKYGEKTWLESLNIREGLAKLGEREKKIINLRFFVGKTQMEVAEEIGISQAQVSRLEKGALLQLRKYI